MMVLALPTMLTFPQRWLLQQQVPPVKRDPGRGFGEYSIDSSCAQQLRRPFGDKRTDHYGNKTQVPKNPLFDTFKLTLLRGGASAWRRHSTASRAVKRLLQTASALVTKI